MMSNTVIITTILIGILVGILAVGIQWLKYKRSIVFSIASVIVVPIVIGCAVGLILGARGVVHFLWGGPLVVIATSVALEIISRMVKKPLKDMVNTVDLLAEGDMDVNFDEKFQKGKNELSLVMRRLAKLTESLKNIAAFANHVGKGELNSEYTLLGKNDDLGKAMLDMRANLQKAEAEKEVRQREDERRNWITQGMAKFADLLRANNDNIEELCHSIICNLVKYAGANQAGIFILNDEDDEQNPVLELKACYAYERRKYLQKTIKMGEGLVGTCFLERESIYMTHLPKDYIHITSGLGDDAPRALLLVPLKVNEEVYGIIEIAAFTEFEPHVREFIEKVSESIASTIGSVKVNIRTNKLLDISKVQAEEMAGQEEELRQNMEEMLATQEEMHRKQQEAERAQIELTTAMSQNEYQLTKLNMVMDASRIGLWEMEVVKGDPVNPDNTFQWSDEFRRMLGYSGVADFPNVLSSWSDKLHPEDKERTLNSFSKHLLDRTGKTPYDLEYRLLRKDGEYSYFHAFGATIRDGEGYALRVAGAIRDITEEKKADNEMLRREAKLQEVLTISQKSEKEFKEKVHWYESLLDAFDETPISVTDMNKNLTFLNKAALTILGTTREATMGKYCGDVWNVDICKDERCGIECLKCGKGKSEFQVGDNIFTTLASYVKDSEGNNIGHIEVVNNVTGIADKDTKRV